VTGRPDGPADTGDITYLIRVLLFITLLSVGYALSRPRKARDKEQANLLPNVAGAQALKWADPSPWQRKASQDAIVSYALSQEKKWRHWNESMFERSS
jgi:hypothetical protein